MLTILRGYCVIKKKIVILELRLSQEMNCVNLPHLFGELTHISKTTPRSLIFTIVIGAYYSPKLKFMST